MTKPVILVANKCDTEKFESQIGEFNKLGHGEPLAVSAVQNRGKERLLDAIRAHLPAGGAEPPAPEALKLAIVGRRNAGKSTFINSLAGEERVIVSEVPGTTRDSVDVRIERDGKAYIAIDTAGVRKKKSLANDVEFYSMHRAERSIRRADVVLMFFDAMLEISKVDKALAEYVIENHKPAIFVVNKWDMTESRQVRTGTWGDYLRKNFPSLDFVPIAFITAKNGRNVRQVLQLAQALHEQSSARVTTGDLNRVLRWAIEKAAPPDARESSAEDLLWYAGANQSAEHRPDDQRAGTVRQYVSALHREDVPRPSALHRGADQADDPQPPRRGRPLGRGKGGSRCARFTLPRRNAAR